MIVGGYLLVHLNDEIRHEVEHVLSTHYKQFDVRVGAARLVEGRGIEIRNLALHEKDATDSSAPLIEVDEVFLACPVEIKSLLNGLPPLDRVVVRRPYVRAYRRGDGSWNLADLFPLPQASGESLEVIIEHGVVELASTPQSSTARVVLRDISGVVRRGSSDVGSVTIPSDGAPSPLLFALTATSALAKKIEVSGRVDPVIGSLTGKGRLSDVSLAKGELALLPPELRKLTGELEEFRGTVAITSLRIRNGASPGSTLEGAALPFTLHLQLVRGVLAHARLAEPISDLEGDFVCSPTGLHIRRLTGTSGTARFVATLRRDGWRSESPFALTAQIENLNMAERHWKALPALLHNVWDKYRPQGLVDLPRCNVVFDGARMRSDVQIECRNVSVVADRFPYPIRKLTGSVTIRPGEQANQTGHRLDLHVQGQASAEKTVTIDAALAVDETIDQAMQPPLGWVRVAGTGMVVDRTLIDAMPEGPQQFVRELRPSGHFDVVWTSSRTDPSQKEPHKQLELTLLGGSVHYLRFPLPLQAVRGKVYASDAAWEFVDLTATAGDGTVTCSGSLRPPDAHAAAGQVGGPELDLRFESQRLELDSNLHRALAAVSPAAIAAWEALEPSGRVNSTIVYRQTLGTTNRTIEHWIEPHAKSVAIRPKFLPYRLDQLEGAVHFKDGQADFADVRGHHGPTRVVVDGSFQHLGQGAWSLQLSDLSVDRMVVEKELLSALPPALQRVASRLNPRGQMSVDRSHITFRQTSPADPIETAWTLNFDMHQGSLDCGVPVDSISGGISLAGRSRGEEFITEGELKLDVARWNKFFFHDVSGPFYADASQALFGSRVSQVRKVPSRRITANAYGGKVSADAVVSFTPPTRFQISADCQAADLKRFVTETWPTRENVRGLVYGRLEVEGMTQSPETAIGSGTFALREAELYELPQVIRLFKVLRLRDPDRTAFTQADGQFEISGRHVHLRDLQLKGDALTLRGSGTVDFDQRLNLAFHSDLTPNDAPLGGLRSIVRQASNQVMRLHVEGTIADPRFNPEPLPGLNHVLQQIQEELDPQARVPSEQRGARRWFDPFWR